MSTQTVVIKYGGHAMDKDELNAAFADDMAFLQQSMRLVVVHGGGPQINALLNRLAIESRFEKGLRVTDADTMQAVEMVLCGQVNKTVVSRFLQHGARAAGLSGRDAGLLRARVKDPVLGLVGDVEKVDASVLSCLLDGGFLPVVAPVASGPEGQALNINADTAAGAVAGALHADYFVLISDVPGVLDADKKLIPSLDRARIAELIEAGVINGGMIPTYLIIQKLGMLNKIWALVLPSAISTYNMIIMRTFFENTIPNELIEAAALDGCNDITTFFRIVLPLSGAVFAVMALFYGVAQWNSWFPALLYIRDRSLYPLQMILREVLIQSDIGNMAGSTGDVEVIGDGLKYATMVVSTLPIMCLYPFLQKYFVAGVTIGAVKG